MAKVDATILRCSQPANIASMQSTNDLYAMAGELADAFDQLALKMDILKKGAPFFYSMWKYFATHPRADIKSTTLKIQSLIAAHRFLKTCIIQQSGNTVSAIRSVLLN